MDWHFTCALGYNMLSIGKMQALKMLTAFQCLAEAGPRRPTPGYVCQCIELIMHPMMGMGISFTMHTVLASALSICSSWSGSLETDVSTADVLSLPLSIGSARDLVKKSWHQSRDRGFNSSINRHSFQDSHWGYHHGPRSLMLHWRGNNVTPWNVPLIEGKLMSEISWIRVNG